MVGRLAVLIWFGCTNSSNSVGDDGDSDSDHGNDSSTGNTHEQRQQWQQNTLYTNNRNTWTCRHVLNSDLHTNTYSYIHSHTHQSKRLSHTALDCGGHTIQQVRTRAWNAERTVCKGIREYAMKASNNNSSSSTNAAAAYESNEAKKDRSHAMLLYIINYQDTCFHATHLAHIRFPRKNPQSQRLLSIHSKLFSENVFNPLPWTKCNDWHLFGMVVSVATL